MAQIKISDEFGYITIAEGRAARTKGHGDGINVDLDKQGCVLGIEILGVKHVSAEELLTVLDQYKLEIHPVAAEAPRKARRPVAKALKVSMRTSSAGERKSKRT